MRFDPLPFSEFCTHENVKFAHFFFFLFQKYIKVGEDCSFWHDQVVLPEVIFRLLAQLVEREHNDGN